MILMCWSLNSRQGSSQREVVNVVLDYSMRTATTDTPQFLGLPEGTWFQAGGFENAGEGIIIGLLTQALILHTLALDRLIVTLLLHVTFFSFENIYLLYKISYFAHL